VSVGPFPVGDVIARLKAQVPALKYVGNGADLRAVTQNGPNVVPAAYVLVEEKGDKASVATGGVVVQSVHAAVQVVMYVRNYAQEQTGAAARKDMDQLMGAMRTALVGWKPTENFMQLTFMANRDESYVAGLLCTQEIYRSQYRIQTTAP